MILPHFSKDSISVIRRKGLGGLFPLESSTNLGGNVGFTTPPSPPPTKQNPGPALFSNGTVFFNFSFQSIYRVQNTSVCLCHCTSVGCTDWLLLLSVFITEKKLFSGRKLCKILSKFIIAGNMKKAPWHPVLSSFSSYLDMKLPDRLILHVAEEDCVMLLMDYANVKYF